LKNEDIRIAYLADGSSVHTKRFLNYFAERGYTIHLITYTPSEMKNVHVHKVATSRLKLPLRVVQSVSLIRKIKPDILHAFYLTNNGVIGVLSSFHPLILTPLGSDITTDPERSRIFRTLVKLSLKRADVVHAADNLTKSRLIELGCAPERIFVQQFGVDTNRFSPTACSQSLRRRLAPEDDTFLVLCGRWWRPQYSVDVFVKAMPSVLKKVSNVKFVLLGGGPLEKKLRELAVDLGVYEKVLFVGKVSPEEMPKYLASVDVYVDTVSVYRTDELGNVMVAKGESGLGQNTREAMACGTPQVLCDMPGVKSGGWFQGLAYKQADPEDLAEKIVQLLNNEELRKRIGERSRETVLEICDLEKTMKKWETVYRALKSSGRHEKEAN
jgi:glycosyltransferase involved in cell wall biosynthesis